MEEQLARLADYVVANYQRWLIFPAIVLAGYLVIRTTDKYVARFFDRVEYDRTLEILFQKTIKVFLWSVVFILALANVGFDVSGFIAGLGVLGFIVGFAVKDVLSNLAAVPTTPSLVSSTYGAIDAVLMTLPEYIFLYSSYADPISDLIQKLPQSCHLFVFVAQDHRPTLDAWLQAQRLQQRGDALDLTRGAAKGIEVLHVGGQRHRVEALVGEQTQGVVESMVLQAVGVVAEEERHGGVVRNCARLSS